MWVCSELKAVLGPTAHGIHRETLGRKQSKGSDAHFANREAGHRVSTVLCTWPWHPRQVHHKGQPLMRPGVRLPIPPPQSGVKHATYRTPTPAPRLEKQMFGASIPGKPEDHRAKKHAEASGRREAILTSDQLLLRVSQSGDK